MNRNARLHRLRFLDGATLQESGDLFKDFLRKLLLKVKILQPQSESFFVELRSGGWLDGWRARWQCNRRRSDVFDRKSTNYRTYDGYNPADREKAKAEHRNREDFC